MKIIFKNVSLQAQLNKKKMKNFIVCYELMGEGRDDSRIEEKLTSLNGEKIMNGVWILKLDDVWTHEMVEIRMKDCFELKKGDKLLISIIETNYVAYFKHIKKQ